MTIDLQRQPRVASLLATAYRYRTPCTVTELITRDAGFRPPNRTRQGREDLVRLLIGAGYLAYVRVPERPHAKPVWITEVGKRAVEENLLAKPLTRPTNRPRKPGGFFVCQSGAPPLEANR